MGNFLDKAWETVKSSVNYLWNNLILGKDYTKEQAIKDAKNLEDLNNFSKKMVEDTLPLYTEKLKEDEIINSEDQKTIHEKFNTLQNNENSNNQNLINENQQQEYNIAGWQAWAEEQQKKQWEREDAIRRETQAREDNAISRAVQDARNAGINPNLMNINPAQAGGGINSATGINTGLTEEQMQEQLRLLEQMIDNEFNADEKQKDRLLDILGKIILFAGVRRIKK